MEADPSQREFPMEQFPPWSASDSLPHPTQMQEQGVKLCPMTLPSEEGKPRSR